MRELGRFRLHSEVWEMRLESSVFGWREKLLKNVQWLEILVGI